MSAILYYAHDPMCSWCWAFRPVWLALLAQLPEGTRVQRLLGGLAPDTDEPMPDQSLQHRLLGVSPILALWRQTGRQPRAGTVALRAIKSGYEQRPQRKGHSFTPWRVARIVPMVVQAPFPQWGQRSGR